jgi:exopolysaccharide production protein ExoY
MAMSSPELRANNAVTKKDVSQPLIEAATEQSGSPEQPRGYGRPTGQTSDPALAPVSVKFDGLRSKSPVKFLLAKKDRFLTKPFFVNLASTFTNRPKVPLSSDRSMVRPRKVAVGFAPGGNSKRALDVLLSSAALVVLSPVILTVAALVRMNLGGPIIFAHERIGHNGVPFKCLKFRTMVVDADVRLKEHLAQNPEMAREWQETRKLRNDPRVTRLGLLLRKSSLDELPQLLNVIRGDMSCVGPRPIVAAELDRYGGARNCYLSARPGITGLWQVSGRSNLQYDERVNLDRQYVENWSLALDLKIMARTIPAVLSANGTA